MIPLLSSALALAAVQPVLPLEPRGKRPFAGLGLCSATQDRETVRSWWSRWPLANIGLRCDGLTVFDVDGEAGEDSLRGLERRFGRLPATRSVQTGKGRHLFFVSTSRSAIRQRRSATRRGSTSVAGLAATSSPRRACHASGRRYSWLDERQPAPLPASWRERLTAIVVTTGRPSFVHTLERFERETAYGRAALDSELERLLRVREGKRNERLHLAVFRLAQLVAGGQLPRDRVERDCLEVALLLGLGVDESRLTIRSGDVGRAQIFRAPLARARVRARFQWFLRIET